MSILRQTHIFQPEYAELIKLHELDEAVLMQMFQLNETTRFGIRLMKYADVPYLHQAINQSIHNLSHWLLFGASHYTMGTARQWVEAGIEWAQKGLGFEFLIHHVDEHVSDPSYSANKHVLGGVSINPIEPGSRFANIGYWLTDGAQGKGIASLSALFAAHIAFTQLKLQRVEFIIDVANQGSIAVVERIHAHKEGCLRKRLRIAQTYRDAYIYSLTPEDLGYASIID